MKILTDTHAHTIASTHAFSTLHDHLQVAAQKGLELFAITDHGSAMPDSPHDWHFGNMQVIPRVINNIVVLRGIEANILSEKGNLDLPPYLGILDLVIASFHTPTYKPGTKQEHTKALINTIESGLCQIIGHPGNPAYPFDIDEVVKAAINNNVLLEINNSSFAWSRPGSTENCRNILERIGHHNGNISFGSDAHISYNLGDFNHCIDLVNEIGFPKENIISATPEKLLKFLTQHGKTIESELTDWLAQKA